MPVRLPRSAFLLLATDLALVMLAWALAFWLRFNLEVPQEFVDLALSASPWCLLAYGSALSVSRVYRQVWSYIGLPELRQLTMAIMLGGLLAKR